MVVAPIRRFHSRYNLNSCDEVGTYGRFVAIIEDNESNWLQIADKGAIAVIGTTGRSGTNDKIGVLQETVAHLVTHGHDRFGGALRWAKIARFTEDPQDRERSIMNQLLLGVSSQRLNVSN